MDNNSQSDLEMDLGLDQGFFHTDLELGKSFPHSIGRGNCVRILDKRRIAILGDHSWLSLIICVQKQVQTLLVCFMIHDSRTPISDPFLFFFVAFCAYENCRSILKLVEAISRAGNWQ
jgi:hypothetical protein